MVTAADASHLKAGAAPQQSACPEVAGVGSCLHQQSLNTDEMGRLRHIALDFQAEIDCLSDAFHQSVERFGLRMTSAEFRNRRDVIARLVSLDDDAEFSLHGTLLRTT